MLHIPHHNKKKFLVIDHMTPQADSSLLSQSHLTLVKSLDPEANHTWHKYAKTSKSSFNQATANWAVGQTIPVHKDLKFGHRDYSERARALDQEVHTDAEDRVYHSGEPCWAPAEEASLRRGMKHMGREKRRWQILQDRQKSCLRSSAELILNKFALT